MGEDSGALLQDFVQESTEMLEGLDQLFVALESNPDDLDIINQIFRPVHSIKGNSSFFNLVNIKNFSHTLETLLQEIRGGKRKVNKEVISVLLTGMDMLREMIGRFAGGDRSTEMNAEETTHLNEMKNLIGGGGASAETPESLAQQVREALAAIGDAVPDVGQLRHLKETCEKLVDLVAPQKTAVAKVVNYRLGGADVTASVELINRTIPNLAEWAKTNPEAMTAFEKAIGDLINVAGKDAPLGQLLVKMEDQFSTIYQSGIPFDDLLASIFSDIMTEAEPLFEKVEVDAPSDAGYKLNGADVSAEINLVNATIKVLVEAQKDAEKMAAFEKAIGDLVNAAGKDSPVGQLFVKMEDQFATIYHSGIPFDDLLASIFSDLMNEVEPQLEPAGGAVAPVEEKKDEKKVEEKKEEHPAKHEKAQKSLRVSEETIDIFIAYVSELITTGEVFHYLQKHLEQNADPRKVLKEFKNANNSFSNLSTNLQKSIMAIRRVPMKQILQKLPRIVRDVATQLDKKVELTIEGEDLQIDKSLLENLESPLVHMVRNSVDHGVEPPDVRAAAGKPEVGEVKLIAKMVDDRCVIKLIDDGAGINVDAVKKKAVTNGVITQEKADAMADAEAFRLIFAAGISTAKKITDVSGRGVGMDVVLTNITQMNGTVDIVSKYGFGTDVTIVLPISMMTLVIDGVIAQVGENQYIIPLVDIRNLIRPNEDQFSSIAEKGRMLMVREELYRLLRMHEFFALSGKPMSDQDSTIILVESEGKTCGLVVDKIIGQQSVVLKRMDSVFKDQTFLKGTAILGDGRVGLVLDTKNLMSAAYHLI
ncbi:MAG: chemotaxis protein CheA [Planctomycetota bacterium]|jgi:two-component system chemotaxis sensor kinase CheA|nr:chemotaxis protein CheA [Planctomycetota bacterium]